MSINNATRFDSERLSERGIDEFIGICKGILFDGIVTFDEAINLLKWLDNNPLVSPIYPTSEVLTVLQSVNEDGNLSPDNEAALLILLTKITGSPKVFLSGDNASSTLPLCDPPPNVAIDGSIFILTGNMQHSSRKDFKVLIESLGGAVLDKTVRKDTDFLIIGDVGSSAWMHSTHGRKIERAMKLRSQGSGISIISEAHFLSFVV